MHRSSSAGLLQALRHQSPSVHRITYSVAANFIANVLLAIGAAPATVDIVGEADPFAPIAGGLLVNLGTPTPAQRAASQEAVFAANEAGAPWVLDPVAIGALPVRTALAEHLTHRSPFPVSGNASEVSALPGVDGGGKGVEATGSTDAAVSVAIALVEELGTAAAVSGPEDLITDGEQALRVANGDVLLTKVTGGGCAVAALIAAFASVRGEASLLEAVAATHVVYGIAAEQAVAQTSGPGYFAVRLRDALHAVSTTDVIVAERVRTETIPFADGRFFASS